MAKNKTALKREKEAQMNLREMKSKKKLEYYHRTSLLLQLCNAAYFGTAAKMEIILNFLFFKSRVCPCQRPPYEMEDPARELKKRVWEFVFIYIFRSSQTNYCNSASFSFAGGRRRL
jgi:hypothetical protein